MPAPIHTDQIAWLIARDYNFLDLDETMYEYFEIEDEAAVLRVANTKFASRAHFLLDKTEFEF